MIKCKIYFKIFVYIIKFVEGYPEQELPISSSRRLGEHW